MNDTLIFWRWRHVFRESSGEIKGYGGWAISDKNPSEDGDTGIEKIKLIAVNSQNMGDAAKAAFAAPGIFGSEEWMRAALEAALPHLVPDTTGAAAWHGKDIPVACPLPEYGAIGAPLGYSIDPGAGSAGDRLMKEWPNDTGIHSLRERDGCITALWPKAADHSPQPASAKADSVWEKIGSDPQLAHARKVLSIHEIRTIIRHALGETS